MNTRSIIWAAVALIVTFVLGGLAGASHQQSVFDQAVGDA